MGDFNESCFITNTAIDYGDQTVIVVIRNPYQRTVLNTYDLMNLFFRWIDNYDNKISDDLETLNSSKQLLLEYKNDQSLFYQNKWLTSLNVSYKDWIKRTELNIQNSEERLLSDQGKSKSALIQYFGFGQYNSYGSIEDPMTSVISNTELSDIRSFRDNSSLLLYAHKNEFFEVAELSITSELSLRDIYVGMSKLLNKFFVARKYLPSANSPLGSQYFEIDSVQTSMMFNRLQKQRLQKQFEEWYWCILENLDEERSLEELEKFKQRYNSDLLELFNKEN